MPSNISHLKDYYIPANIEQYKESLEVFDWKTFLSDNYYPTLDSIHAFLLQLAREQGKEWTDAYNQIYERNLIEKSIEIQEKVAKNNKKVAKNNKKDKRSKNLYD